MGRPSKPAHGGRRPGAGRPRTRERPSVVVTTRLEPEEVVKLDAWGQARELSRSPAVAELVRRGLRKR